MKSNTLIFLIFFFGQIALGQNPKKLLKLGEKLQAQENYAQAINAYGLALYFDTSLTAIYEKRGDCYFHQSEWEKALLDYFKVKNFQDSVNVLYRIGHCHLRRDSFGRATALFEEKLKITPSDSLSWYELGLAYYHLEQFENSFACFKKSYEHGYETARLFTLMGHACFALSDFRCSIDYYSRQLKTFPDDSLAIVERGIAYRNLNLLQNSTNDLLKFSNKNDELTYLIGLNYLDQDQCELALPYFEEIVNTANYPLFDYQLGLIFYQLQEYQKAKTSFTAYIKSGEDAKEIARSEYYIANILETGENYEEAIKYYDKYLKVHPEDSAAYWHRGYAHYQEYEWELAIKDLTRLLTWDQKSVRYYNVLAESYFENENYLEAIPYFTQALLTNPSEKSAYSFRSIAYLKSNNFNASLEDMEAFVVGDDSARVSNFFYLNRELTDTLRFDFWRKALEQDSTDALYTFFVGLNHKQTDQKVALYYKSTLLDSTLYEPNFLLAQHFYFQKQYDSSYVYYQNAIRLEPTNMSLYKDAGKAITKSENYSAGVDNALIYLINAKNVSDSLSAYQLLGSNYFALDSLAPTLAAEMCLIKIQSQLFPNDDVRITYFDQVLSRANQYFEQRKYKEAAFWLSCLRTERPTDVITSLKLASTYQLMGRTALACEIISETTDIPKVIAFKKKYCK